MINIMYSTVSHFHCHGISIMELYVPQSHAPGYDMN